MRFIYTTLILAGQLTRVIQSQQDFNLIQTGDEEQKVYSYISKLSVTESPEEIVVFFRNLFIEGISYKDPEIRKNLEAIVNNTKYTEGQFHKFITNCCYIAIYFWQKDRKAPVATVYELVFAFNKTSFSTNKAGSYRKLSRIKNWLNSYKNSEEYLKLKRLIKILQKYDTESQAQIQEEQDENYVNQQDPNLISNLIQRYPYLYESYLLTESNSNEAKKIIQTLRSRIQHNFELSLVQYMTDKLRIKQRQEKFSDLRFDSNNLRSSLRKDDQDSIIPTLLDDQELDRSLRHFVIELKSGYSYRSLAKSFLDSSQQTNSFKSFKDDIYQYLIFGLEPRYGKHHFNSQLTKVLQNILPEANEQRPNEFMTIRVCSSLLNFLIVDPSQPHNYYVFMDLVTNVGAAETVGLLLKLLLICPKIRPSLEKRLSILVTHYECSTRSQVPWLIKSLENFQLASSAHFGKVDLSYYNLIEQQ
jgi:hypothetical protein